MSTLSTSKNTEDLNHEDMVDKDKDEPQAFTKNKKGAQESSKGQGDSSDAKAGDHKVEQSSPAEGSMAPAESKQEIANDTDGTGGTVPIAKKKNEAQLGNNVADEEKEEKIEGENTEESSEKEGNIIDKEGEDLEDAHPETEGDQQKQKVSPTKLPQRPLKRARTAYFIFTDEKRPKIQAEHPGEGVAVVARIMGQMWSKLTDDEKKAYQLKAGEERERISKELEAWKAAGGVIEDEKEDANNPTTSLIYPIGRIRKIIKLDPEVRGVSKEALLLITKCAELATAKLGKESVRVAQIQNRRKLLPEDVANVCSHREQFLFLKDDIKDLVKGIPATKHDPEKTAIKKGDAAKKDAAVGSKPLTSYFGATKK